MYGFPGAVGICLGQWAAGVCTHRLCHLHRKIPPSGYPQRLYQAEMAAAVADFLHTNLIAQYCHWQRPIQKQWIKMGWLKVLTHQTRPLGLEFWPGVYQLFYKKIHERLANMEGIPTLTFGAGIPPPPWTHFFPGLPSGDAHRPSQKDAPASPRAFAIGLGEWIPAGTSPNCGNFMYFNVMSRREELNQQNLGS